MVVTLHDHSLVIVHCVGVPYLPAFADTHGDPQRVARLSLSECLVTHLQTVSQFSVNRSHIEKVHRSIKLCTL